MCVLWDIKISYFPAETATSVACQCFQLWEKSSLPKIRQVLETKYGLKYTSSVLLVHCKGQGFFYGTDGRERPILSCNWCEKYRSMDRMASTNDTMTRNLHVVFTKISHFWEDYRRGKVNQTLVMDLGISFSLTLTYHHIIIWAAREGSGTHHSSSSSLGMVVGSPTEVGGFLSIHGRAPLPVFRWPLDMDLAVQVDYCIVRIAGFSNISASGLPGSWLNGKS